MCCLGRSRVAQQSPAAGSLLGIAKEGRRQRPVVLLAVQTNRPPFCASLANRFLSPKTLYQLTSPRPHLYSTSATNRFRGGSMHTGPSTGLGREQTLGSDPCTCRALPAA